MLFSSSYMCPMNCFCDSFKAECTLENCDDRIDTEYSVLEVHGNLCANHGFILNNIVDGTNIVLHDEICGEIPNWQ